MSEHTNIPKYLVTVEGGALQSFEHISSAIDYASRHVYLAPKHMDMLTAALREGQAYTYSYGLKSVTIRATAKEIPKSLIDAAPELLEALQLALDELNEDTEVPLREIKRRIRAALAKAEGAAARGSEDGDKHE